MADKTTTKIKATKEAKKVLTTAELHTEFLAKTNDYVSAKRGHKMGELTNPRVLTVTRKEIARIKTAIRAAEIAKAKEIK